MMLCRLRATRWLDKVNEILDADQWVHTKRAVRKLEVRIGKERRPKGNHFVGLGSCDALDVHPTFDAVRRENVTSVERLPSQHLEATRRFETRSRIRVDRGDVEHWSRRCRARRWCQRSGVMSGLLDRLAIPQCLLALLAIVGSLLIPLSPLPFLEPWHARTVSL
jgi:hypothetical protein